MQSETGFPSSHQLKSYVASKSRLKLAARAVLSADAGLLVSSSGRQCNRSGLILARSILWIRSRTPNLALISEPRILKFVQNCSTLHGQQYKQHVYPLTRNLVIMGEDRWEQKPQNSN